MPRGAEHYSRGFARSLESVNIIPVAASIPHEEGLG
jgi:hypothetical protein